MTQIDLLEEFKKMPPYERLEFIKAAIHNLKEDLQKSNNGSSQSQLAVAAQALLKDYQNDEELTAFTCLDGEPIHE
jgi:hypothetical protein